MWTRLVWLFVLLATVVDPITAQEKILTSNAANNYFEGADLVRINPNSSQISFVKLSETNSLPLEEFFALFHERFDLSKNFTFKLVKDKIDKLGIRHLKYQQHYRGKELTYSNLMLHIQDNKVQSFNGQFYLDEPLDSDFLIEPINAFEIAKNEVRAELYDWDLDPDISAPKIEKVFISRNIYSNDNGIIPVYRINIYAKKPLSRLLFFINAKNGEIEFRESLLHSGNSKGTAITAYSDTQKIVTDSMPNVFRLVDSTRGGGVETYDCNTTTNYAAATDFLDSNNFWNNVNPELDEYATDAHWGTARTYDYLKDRFDFNSINDSGFTLKSYIHYDVNYVNAFWDGQRMTYGDGDATNSPLVVLDVVAHEITHGLTRFNAGLIYANESGALNESFSDIFGTTIEFYARPNRANWLIGEDIGGALRSISNPSAYNDPDTYGGLNWIDQNCISTRSNDRCGVHTNSGVQNYWFYLLSEGGVGINDNADSFDVSGIGMSKAEQIAFRTLTVYLSPSSNYKDARYFSILSASDIYGACSDEVESVTNAWYAVGVGKAYKDEVSADFISLVDTSFCSVPVEIQFNSEASNAIKYKWNLGNGDTSNLRDPVVTYQNQGTYTIELIIDGGSCGSDTVTKTNYVRVDTNLACAHFISDTGRQVVSSCIGRLYDSGGASEDYINDRFSEFTIDVPSADFIELTFNDVVLEASQGFTCNRDYIEVFDGKSINANMIGRYCSEHLPPNNLISSSSNAITIRFFSDDVGNNKGFLLSWECKVASSKPDAKFDVLIDTSCNGIVPFFNRTTGGADAFKWSFGDGSTSTEKDPVNTYDNDGTFSVELIATNSFGSDTFSLSSAAVITRVSVETKLADSFCLNADAGIKALTSNPVFWYADTNLLSLISSKDSVTIKNIQKDSTLFVRETPSVKKLKGSFSDKMGVGEFSSDNDYLIFDVHKPIVIDKIALVSNERGRRSLEVRNNKGEIVAQSSVSIIGRKSSTTVGIKLYPDTAYRMSVSDRNNALYKNTAGASYPYQIGDLVTITGSNLSSTQFPYFYEWEVSSIACEGKFTAVTAKVDTSCVITNLNEESSPKDFRVYPNPTNGLLYIEGERLWELKRVQLFNSFGQLMLEELKGFTSNLILLDLNVYQNGVYFLRFEFGNQVELKRILKTN